MPPMSTNYSPKWWQLSLLGAIGNKDINLIVPNMQLKW
jgi:hypothetical protein